MKNFLKLSVVAIGLMFASCDDGGEPTVFDDTLTVHVLKYGTFDNVSGAKVLVYKSLQNLADEENLVTQGLTDEKGHFETSENIEKGVNYFIDIEKGCQNNYVDILTGEENGYKSKRNTDVAQLVVTSIKETGTVKLTNKNYFGVLVFLNDVAVGSIAIDEEFYLDHLPTHIVNGLKLVNTDTNEEISTFGIKSVCGETKEYILE
ncbi:hypothetical protein [Tenacibaculum piscium]|uniref:hypothetical protein n=1 Tax=Tenacibaculum piscium TaxID=1458515 RepID=UPI001F406664|nr:hypothetical protein [Tenacibaculum piscium]